MENTNLSISALRSRYDADIKECLATLNTYFNNSVGIGEHPDLIKEMDKYLSKLSDAKGKLETLGKHFTDGGTVLPNSGDNIKFKNKL